MDILADTNILIRRINRYDPQHRDVRAALQAAETLGHRICIVPQNLVECWNVGTRPADRNGLGLTPAHLERITARLEERFHLYPETGEVFAVWKSLVARHRVSGLKVHDARLVASALVIGAKAILTYNHEDFRRYDEVKALHPRDLTAWLQELDPAGTS